MGLDETLLNTYTGHARNSKSTNEYNVFAERLKGNEIATKLSDTCGLVECNPEMPSCNIDKLVSELLTMVSNKLVGMRCLQSFMEGYAHAVR
ncbi:MAG: hypothetical protein EZS28_054341 [Streblomastix strix]|uniref:Uncharacterized protein n=1 Tax=Streblomastix strix TaxID=222440 RepID=A0A5J4QQC3_9EUKA|nr:MAG: hypothetical protein EZS28_054341 [Streblomastix strix]